uniref:BED-type domain-containing protein n=1 Tax=Kalanchoe fedtschenkoi TaxID=63787 RepID=A0A7N0TBM7_KALFE
MPAVKTVTEPKKIGRIMTSNEDDKTSLMRDSFSISSNGAVKTIVWNYFERVTVLDLKKARCVHCKCLLTVELMNETSHLHAQVKSSLKNKNQVVRQYFLDVNNKDEVNSQGFDQQRFTEKLVSMIIAHEYSLSIVDHIGFKKYSFSF